eukprot:SAG31_NODE_17287_length_676_cov_1.883882_1_plen_30_part_10
MAWRGSSIQRGPASPPWERITLTPEHTLRQ